MEASSEKTAKEKLVETLTKKAETVKDSKIKEAIKKKIHSLDKPVMK